MARKDALLRLRQILIKRRDALRKALTGDLSPLQELAQERPEGDEVDLALDTAQDEISSQLVDFDSRELAKIEAALERMREGQFGVCEMCNKQIPLTRLKALPYATMCIKCQREAELHGLEPHEIADFAKLRDADLGDDVTLNDIEMDVS